MFTINVLVRRNYFKDFEHKLIAFQAYNATTFCITLIFITDLLVTASLYKDITFTKPLKKICSYNKNDQFHAYFFNCIFLTEVWDVTLQKIYDGGFMKNYLGSFGHYLFWYKSTIFKSAVLKSTIDIWQGLKDVSQNGMII